MNSGRGIHDTPRHEEICFLLPWYVNGTISELDRQKVDLHLDECAACREDLLQERSVYQRMAAAVGVEYMSGPSLKRLHAKLDELAQEEELTEEEEKRESRLQTPRVEPPSGRSMPWSGLLAASLAVMAVALSLLAATGWMQIHARGAQPNYYTVTTPAARPANEIIRAVFSPTITLVELQSILDESQLRIISGPTEAGVYSLAATSAHPMESSSLAILRRHATVRFAESTQPLPEPGASR
ncbi:MAG TPA: zf-HC2 domain-containing protein [Steroidobacteraceae bacterium]